MLLHIMTFQGAGYALRIAVARHDGTIVDMHHCIQFGFILNHTQLSPLHSRQASALRNARFALTTEC